MYKSVFKVVTKQVFTLNLIKVQLSLEGSKVDFKPGQYISLKVGPSIRRSYSIANPPHDNDLVDLYIDVSPGGPGSKFFQKLEEGAEVEGIFPLGNFIYREGDTPVTFWATGTGLMPFLSMLRHELEVVKSGRKINLYYGIRYEEDFVEKERWENYVNENKHLEFVPFLSMPSDSWTGKVGRITEMFMEDSLELEGEHYLCGSGAMIDEVKVKLIRKGVEKNKIYYEKYY